MAKRFTDTNIWVDKPWFIDLSPVEKCAFMFIKDRCDAVGVWTPNFKMAETCIGNPVTWEELISKVNDNIIILDSGKWWVSDMCAFQYGDLTEEIKDKARLSYVRLLKKHGLWKKFKGASKGLVVGMDAHKEKEKEKEKVKVKEEEEKREIKPDVFLTEAEYARLTTDYKKADVDGIIDDLSNALGNNYPKDKYKDHNKTIRKWLKRAGVTPLVPPKKCKSCGTLYTGTLCRACGEVQNG